MKREAQPVAAEGPTSAPIHRRQRRTALVLGALFGFAYGLVSQCINRVALPGIPLHQPPLGPLGNTILSTVVGALLALIVAWPSSAAVGVGLAILAAGAAILAVVFLRLAGDIGMSLSLIVSAVFSAPLAWMAAPAVALLRWLAARDVELVAEGAPRRTRCALPIALIVGVGLLACFDLESPSARAQLRDTDALVRAGLAASTAADAPAPLHSRGTEEFPFGISQRYTLEWTVNDLDRFIELRPASSYDQHAAVIARLADGYTLVCLYPTPRSEPACGAYR